MRFVTLYSWLLSALARLKQLDDMLSSACQSAEAAYKVLYWDNHIKSSRSVCTHVHIACN